MTLIALAPLAGYLGWRVTGDPATSFTVIVASVLSVIVNRSERLRWRLIPYLLITIGAPLVELGLRALGWVTLAPPAAR